MNPNNPYYIPPFRTPQAPSNNNSQPQYQYQQYQQYQQQQYLQQQYQQYYQAPPTFYYQNTPYLAPLVLPSPTSGQPLNQLNYNNHHSYNQRGFGGMMEPNFERRGGNFQVGGSNEKRDLVGSSSNNRISELDESVVDIKPVIQVEDTKPIQSTSSTNIVTPSPTTASPAPTSSNLTTTTTTTKLPSVGDTFPSIEAFKIACKSSGTTFTRGLKISSTSYTVECTKKEYYGCRARIVIKRDGTLMGSWHVDEGMSRFVHTNHEMSFKERKRLEENIKNQEELDKLTMPQVNQIYPSKLALHTSLSYASHKLGYKIRVLSRSRSTTITQSVVLGCDHSSQVSNRSSKNLSKCCPVLLRATEIDGKGSWKVVEFISDHNHPGGNVGVWKKPTVRVSARVISNSSRGRKVKDEESGYRDEDYDMLDSDGEDNVEKVEAGPSNSKRQRRSISQSTSRVSEDQPSPIPTASTSTHSFEVVEDVKPIIHLPTPSSISNSPAPLLRDNSSSKPSYRKISLKELNSFLFHLSPILVNIASVLYAAGIDNNFGIMNLISTMSKGNEFDIWWKALEDKEVREGRKLSPVAKAILRGKIESLATQMLNR